jgi:tetratricopeptide (TPR) repeat protein
VLHPLLCALTAAAPLLPQSPGPFTPGQLEIAGDGVVHAAELRDVQTCGGCHPDAVAQWRSSAHAFASFNNPLYRLSVDRLRMERGTTASRMCAACHDVALLTDGAMDEPQVRPDDARAHAAITCQTCHGIVRTRMDGNGSYALATEEIPLPSDKEPGSLERHKARVGSAALRTAELCGSCHRSFLDATTGNASAFFGMDDFTPWSKSVFAGAKAMRIDEGVPERDCKGCHMPKEAAPEGDASAKHGVISSHRWLGGHSYLAAMQHDAGLVERYRRFLSGIASVDVAPGAALDGRTLTFDVVIRSLGIGHRFPGGVMDAQDTRLEVVVRDAHGRELSRDDSHALRAEVLDAQGEPLKLRETHRFVTAVWNRTIEPRGVQAARYRLEVPPGAELPVSITARLLHKSRNDVLAKAACAESQTPVGVAFTSASKKLNGIALDPCVEQPVIEVATATETVHPEPFDKLRMNGGGNHEAAGAASSEYADPRLRAASAPIRLRPAASAQGERDLAAGPEQTQLWERYYFHGLALSGGLQEYSNEARAPLEHALALAPDDRAKAQVLLTLASLDGSQGRTSDALATLQRAEALAPGHPAIDRVRGQAYATVWRWSEASDAFKACAQKVPRDLEAWRLLAASLGSAGRDLEALEAAQRGLMLQPREPDLLRVQALSLAALGFDAHDALGRALEYRLPDNGPSVKAACSREIEGCAAERNPVPLRAMKP